MNLPTASHNAQITLLNEPPAVPLFGGEMGRHVRELDWSATLLGAVDAWPQSLKTAVTMALDSGFPMLVLWGPQLIQIYNDGYCELMGTKHPAGLGQATQACWPEVWHINAPIYARVWRGETVKFEDSLYPVMRHGYFEPVPFTLCYSPLRDETHAIAGILVTMFETTARLRATARTEAQLEYQVQLLALANDAIVGFDDQWRITYLNGAAEQLYGWLHDEALGKTAAEVFQPAEAPEAAADHAVRLHLRRNGEPLWVDVNVRALFDSDGQLAGYVSVNRDATERIAIEAALRTSEERLRLATDAAELGIWEWDVSNDQVTWHNHRPYDLFQLPASSEPINAAQFASDFVHRDDAAAFTQAVATTVQTGAPFVFEGRIRRTDGALRWVALTGRRQSDDPSSPLRVLGTAADITERKQTEEFLRHSEEQLRIALTSGRMGTWDLDLATGQMVASNTCKANYGRAPAENFSYDDLAATIVAEDLPSWRQTVTAAIAQASDFAIEYRIRWPDASLHWIYVRGNCSTNAQNVVVSLAGISFDITERKFAELDRERLHTQRQLALDAARLGWWNYDPVQRVAWWDERYQQIFGIAEPQSAVENVFARMHPDDALAVWAKVEAALDPVSAHPYSAEYRIQWPDGSTRWVETHAMAIFEAAPEGRRATRLVGTVADITDRRAAEDTLRASEERYRTLFENIDQAFCIFEMLYDEAGNANDYRFLVVNPTFERHTGLHNAVGKTARALVPGLEAHWFEIYGRVASTGQPIQFEQGSAAMGRWFEVEAVRVGGVDSRKVALLFTDVSERKQGERDTRMLAELGECLRVSEDIDAILADVARMIGEHLALSRCYFVEVNEANDCWMVRSDYGPSPSMVGTYMLSTYSQELLAMHRNAQVVSIDDVARDPLVAATYNEGFAPFGIQAIVIVPLLRDGRWVAELVGCADTPRAWQPHDVTLLETIAERTWNAIEKLRLEAEQRAYAARLQQLSAISLQINAAQTQDAVLRLIATEARALIGATQAAVIFVSGAEWAHAQIVVAYGEEGAAQLATSLPHGLVAIAQQVYAAQRPLRLTEAEHPLVAALSPASVLAIPLVDGDGASIGVLQLMDTSAEAFSAADEALLQQLAQSAAVALENQVLYTQEQAARAQAEEASRLKDEFLATVSHELRTPLTSFLGYAQLLQRRSYDEAYVTRTVAKMVQSAKAQAHLIEDLLDVSRVVGGKLRIDPQPIDLVAVVHAALTTVRPAMDAKQIQLHVDVLPEASTIIGDPNRLQQVVWNLLSNAVKFSPPNGSVWIQLQAHARDVELTVRDTGQGISAEFLPHVFDRFRQADSASSRTYSGLGLGLAIVRHLVELHGGTVAAASAGKGQGSTFTVTLPLDVSDSARQMSPQLEADTALDRCPPELHGLRLLVVDDQDDILELLHDILVPCGAIVRLCATAQEALEAIRTWKPDMLISDIAMPGNDGYWLIRQVRALAAEHGGTIPAVALTAYVRLEDRLHVLAAGFQYYVPKPVEPAELRTVIAALAQAHATAQ